MAKLTYTNQTQNHSDLIAMMKRRGLVFRDEAKALEQLKIIGYFRLASYLRPMESDKLNHIYKPKSTFENAIHPGSSFVERIKALIAEHPNVDVAAMGFPSKWENEPLWK